MTNFVKFIQFKRLNHCKNVKMMVVTRSNYSPPTW